MDDETSELGRMWRDALANYKRECGVDLSRGSWNSASIEADAQRQLDRFKAYRHNDGVVDKLRSFVNSNSAIIQKVAENVLNAASASFPPSAAIVTALNMSLGASKAVSEDFDLIVTFYGAMNSFLERLSLLEDRVPKDRAYRKFLMNVFSDLLEICAIAQKYRDQDFGRIRKWARALVDGNDTKLKTAWEQLSREIQDLESATLMRTLSAALDSNEKVNVANERLERLQDGQRDLLLLGKDHQSVLSVIRTTTSDSNVSISQILNYTSQSASMIQGLANRNEGANAQVDGGARKATALLRLKSELPIFVDMKSQFDACQQDYIENTFTWFTEEPGYVKLKAGQSRVWPITGPSGIGKSMLMHRIVLDLQQHFATQDSTSVAYWFFQDSFRGFNNLRNMLNGCILQAAEQDDGYREDVLTALQRQDVFGSSGMDDARDVNSIWERYLFLQYAPKSRRRLFLVLDGIDQIEKGKHEQAMAAIIQQIAQGSCAVYLVFSSTSSYTSLTESGSGIVPLLLHKSRMAADFRTVARGRVGRLTRLKALSKPTRNRIAAQVSEAADTLVYITHTLRHLNSLGREGAVLQELRQLPSDTNSLYEAMLQDCCKNRTHEQLGWLKRLYIWVAFAQEEMPVVVLARIIDNASGRARIINIDEEVGHRSSR
jgi:hypothetical protein